MEKLNDKLMDKVLGGAGINVSRLAKSGTKPSAGELRKYVCENGHSCTVDFDLDACWICGQPLSVVPWF